ncbi:hypothetical protein NP511_07175 [Natrinema thermotolerans]|uniref:Uncharacterized protein n=1 Tax=Natrinema thermotolerans TaxID=121872 RepID=A0AAF0PHP5_9EURY|nr:hypothetical protein [Natrinema thermotolerans]WMT09410.1 hypothetical protein NP511_07175 [Natrinema thermotolerans]
MTPAASSRCRTRSGDLWPIEDDMRRVSGENQEKKIDTDSTREKQSKSRPEFKDWEDLDDAKDHLDNREANEIIEYIEEITSKLASGEIQRVDSAEIPEDTYTQRHRQVIKKGAERDGS